MKKVWISLIFMVSAPSACLISNLSCQSTDKNEKSNIIFLLADDHRWDCLGFMGDSMVHTPHLDELARSGMYFTNLHHSSPICLPSRASIMLGRYEGSSLCGFLSPADYSLSREEFEYSYPALAGKSGYRTGYIGKYHFSVTEEKVRGKNKYRVPEIISNFFDVWYGYPMIDQLPYKKDSKKGGIYQGNYISEGEYGTSPGEHSTSARAGLAIRFIDESVSENKPFLLSIGFKAPHRPWEMKFCDQRFYKLYEDVEFPLYSNAGKEDFMKLPLVVRRIYRGSRFCCAGRSAAGPSEYYNDSVMKAFAGMQIDTETWGKYGYYDSWDNYQEERRCYYALVSGIDDAVGRIIAELERLGIANNTILIYTSDNGSFLGSRMLEGKDILYCESVRSPLIIYDPRLGAEIKGKVSETLLSTTDIAPTLLDYAGIPVPEIMQGKSIKAIVEGSVNEIHDAVFSENYFSTMGSNNEDKKKYGTVCSKAVTSREFKYIRYYESNPVVEQLFRISKDPYEAEDLAQMPEYFDKLEEMSRICDVFIEANAKQSLKFKVSGE